MEYQYSMWLGLLGSLLDIEMTITLANIILFCSGFLGCIFMWLNISLFFDKDWNMKYDEPWLHTDLQADILEQLAHASHIKYVRKTRRNSNIYIRFNIGSTAYSWDISVAHRRNPIY